MPWGGTVVKVSSKFPEIGTMQTAEIEALVREAAHNIQENVSGGGPTPAPKDTGLLRSSYMVQMVEPGIWQVFSRLRYAPYVEFGTSVNIAQPHLRPAVKREAIIFYSKVKSVMSLEKGWTWKGGRSADS